MGYGGETPHGRRDPLLAVGIATAFLTVGMGNQSIQVEDLGLESGFQDFWGNHYRRGRALVLEDFDGDGRVDFYVGNPGDESTVFRNLGPGPGGVVRFAPALVLLQGTLAFSASAADYDGDSDLDLFVGCGGLEGTCFDFLFRNDSTPGTIRFTDVSQPAGIRGPAPQGVPVAHSTAGGTWGDYDRDGDPDLFVSVLEADPQEVPYKSVLWHNNGDGTFSDATLLVELDYWASDAGSGGLPDWGVFMNSSWIDADNDGDLDLFLNNAYGPNVLWKNYVVEEGAARFENATQAFSLPGEDLRFPFFSFASVVGDFNNDGWQDLFLANEAGEPSSNPYGNGSALFLNQQGQGFRNVSGQAGIPSGTAEVEMAMGAQAADWNADGIPDIAEGRGNPEMGMMPRLLLSEGMSGQTPLFGDHSHLLDFEPIHGIDPALPPFPEIPLYPYRGHGTAAADFDGDGRVELGMVNGGAEGSPDIVREPNRLFKFLGTGLGNTFRVRLAGNGGTDSKDAVGARAYVEIPAGAGKRRVFQTVLAGNGFSAQNERTLTFGLGTDTAVTRLAILWPSGCIQTLDAPPGGFPPSLLVNQDCWACPWAPGPVAAWLDPEQYGCGPCVSDAACQDGLFCNGEERCDPGSGRCVPGTPPSCDDGNSCTADSCDPGADSCRNVPPPPPGEVGNLQIGHVDTDPDRCSISWDLAPLAGGYNIYQSRRPDLTDLTCLISGIQGPVCLVEDPGVAGEAFFYLVTAANCSGEGTLGNANPGGERINHAPCP